MAARREFEPRERVGQLVAGGRAARRIAQALIAGAGVLLLWHRVLAARPERD